MHEKKGRNKKRKLAEQCDEEAKLLKIEGYARYFIYPSVGPDRPHSLSVHLSRDDMSASGPRQNRGAMHPG